MQIKIAGLVDDSVVDGDGYRFAVFVQGCPHQCPGCHNPESWAADGGNLMDTDDILKKILENPLLSGVTFTGGEPFAQPRPLAELAEKIHRHALDLWVFSGFTLESLMAMPDPAIRKLLGDADVLVDGPYIEAQRDLTLHFRGSRNQRVIDMNKTREQASIVLKYAD